jgi:hypothetical protein
VFETRPEERENVEKFSHRKAAPAWTDVAHGGVADTAQEQERRWRHFSTFPAH